MLTIEYSELLAENLSLGEWNPDLGVRQELTHMALMSAELSHLTADLFDKLCKVSGQDLVDEYIGSFLRLAAEGTPAGARLLAAFLNVAYPGERLLPLVSRLDSTRRYAMVLQGGAQALGPFQADWLQRFERIVASAEQWAASQGVAWHEDSNDGPRGDRPWPLLQAVLGDLLDRCAEDGFAGPAEGADLLVRLLRLDVDARQERTSLIAGNVHPFTVETVARVLPLLNRADAAIRDLRQMIAATAEGDFELAFVRPLARWRETLDEKDWGHLYRDLQRRPDFEGLMRLAEGLSERPIGLPQLAWGTRRIIDLSVALVNEGARAEPMDLLTACVVAQTNYGNGQIVLTVDPDLGETISGLLPAPETAADGHPLAGVTQMAGLVVIDLPAGDAAWPDGLPVLREMTDEEQRNLKGWRRDHQRLDPADLNTMRADALALARLKAGEDVDEVDDEVLDMDNAALKHLVLTNIQSVSVTLGFLRNPKVYSIPGLVEDVVNRSRNPQIIATIANDRALHTGFANKGVALACLRSQVNVSIKVLRKFCHVKYVSKVDLKRLAADRTGIRKEVGREIEKYIEALA